MIHEIRTGSIPAWAGEPMRPEVDGRLCPRVRVYPRVGGGTVAGKAVETGLAGCRVYPRVGGGTRGSE